MPSFTTRVELHNAKYDDYQVLHKAMEAERFSRVILGDNGILYHLPLAEYTSAGDVSYTDVRAFAERAAMRTGCSFEILVTEATNRAWQGLKPVAVAAAANRI